MSTNQPITEAEIDTESRLRGTVRELRHSPTAIAGAIMVGVLVVLAVFSTIDLVVFNKQLITAIHADPHQMNTMNRYSPPSLSHPMGTDQFGRDVLSRVIYGSRIALAIGVISVGISFLGGVACGATAAYFGGRIDDLIMRSLEVLYSIPGLILAMTLMAIMGPSVYNLFLAYGVIGIPAYARVMRSEVLSLREAEYVEAARAAGLPTRTILFREIVPNGLTAVIVQATLSMGGVIIGAAALSFLGFGVQPPTASWGRMLNDAQQAMIIAPWAAVFPGMMIFLTVMGFNMLGDGLRDAMDPRTTLWKPDWDELGDDFLPTDDRQREEPDAVTDSAATDGGTAVDRRPDEDGGNR
ncbi:MULTISPECIES: ABC transporter permease [Haladaptatus]|uniref:Peptide/nickel transport system permease protein n=2 Tax=Haladaptatus paucihalophilus DX253 TaxID=797209 RepID=A0A1M6TXL9_HALPU|nr:MULTISPECIES: ABC transporter permease [Haladaptatus]GKZ13046.1 glutathione ABC transporter permease GsiD [Haladaptatus sp. T7]SHK61686.1 peptide/nickel transport system permease protein [Haladaptatus paucihalophilus DX253]